MTLSEAANILKFPEEHIRLYINQDLIPGIKRNIKEPNILEKELTYIKRVIVLRRLRWRFIDIAAYMHGRVSLSKTAKNIANLMEKDFERKIRPDFLILTRQIADENDPQLDADRYMELINNSNELRNDIVEPELNLKAFILADIPHGYIQATPKERTLKNTAVFCFAVCLIMGIIDLIKSRTLSASVDAFLQMVIAFSAMLIFQVLLYFFRRFLGARILHGFAVIILTILCIVLAIVAIIPLIILFSIF